MTQTEIVSTFRAALSSIGYDDARISPLIEQIILGGVAFYQTAPHDEKRFIEYHGYKSIYEKAAAELMNTTIR